MAGVDKIPTKDDYKNALEDDMDLNKNIVKLGELHELAYDDLIVSTNTNSSVGEVAFGLVRDAKV